ncbi:MAG: carbon-nitrogen hydrolase family protein [Actinomycetes bacterium]
MTTTLRTVRVAAVQAAPVVLDLDASVEKAVGLVQEAAAEGAELVVLPECFLSMYPAWAWVGAATTDGAAVDEIFRRLWESAVEVPGPAVDRLVQACRDSGVHVVVGVNEREPGRSYTLYNSMLTLGPDGLLARHRKLMPTMHERMFHGLGAGDDLTVTDTSVGRVGGLVCWENRMPLARYALYRQAPQIWVAPTADTGEGWQALVRAIAIESGAFVVAAPQFVRAADYPADFPVALPAGVDVLSRGGAVVVHPDEGRVLAGPLYDREGTVLADCDLHDALRGKAWFDVAGHYSREQTLLQVLGEPPPAGG